jgi:hypothetical protein
MKEYLNYILEIHRKLLLNFCLIFIFQTINAQTTITEIVVSPGAGNFVVPTGFSLSSLKVEAWGGGGGGAGRPNCLICGNGGGGGGGGAYATNTFTSVPAGTIPYTVGAGGAGGISNTTQSVVGGNTSFTYSTNVIAVGGARNNGTGTVAGGLASACTPTAGAQNGGTSSNGGSGRGGGGGGGAGTLNPGGTPVATSTGGTGGLNNGGNGGQGRPSGTGNGSAAVNPTVSLPFAGGGGGGGYSNNLLTAANGGAGANGMLFFTYTMPAPLITSFAPLQVCNNGASVTITGNYFYGFGGSSIISSVTVNGVAATVTASTSTSITITVPSTTSGPIVVTTTAGTVTSSTNLTINPLPSLPTAVSPSGTTNGCAYAYNLNGTSTGGTIRWFTAPTGLGTLLGSSASASNFSVTPPAAGGTITYYAEGYNTTTGCVSPTRTATGVFTILPTPTVNPITGNTGAICPGTQLSLGGNAPTTVVQKFTTVGTSTFTPPTSGNAEVLVVAGGGGGGSNRGGGGGAGGLIYNTSYALTAGIGVTYTVGAGGTGGTTNDGGDGGNSVFGTLTAIGGGGGGGNARVGRSGGSGGGGSNNKVGGSGTAGQGNKGGNQISSGNYGCGGGGASAAGADATSAGSAGGGGISNSITGVAVTYAGGGGGGNGANGTQYAGGVGGGGTGGNNSLLTSNGAAGAANTGGGGGGGGNWGLAGNGGAGGSGVVIVKYPNYSWTSSNPSVATVAANGTVSAIAIGSTNITYTVYGINGCIASTSTTVNVSSCSYTWNGTSGTDWTTSSNWTPASPIGGPNNCGADVIIPDVVNDPIVPISGKQVGQLTIDANANVTLNGNLSVCKDLVGGNGSAGLTIGSGELVLNGNALQTVTGNIVADQIAIDNSSSGISFSVSANISVNKALTLKNGNVNNTGTITLKSDATNTAYFDNFTSPTAGSFTGNVIVERFIGGATGQHYISMPISTMPLSELSEISPSGSGQIIPKSSCDANNIASNSPYGTLFEWKENASFLFSCSQSGWFVKGSGNTENGRGYSAIVNSGQTLSVSGVPNLNSVSYSLTKSAYTSVPNPTPAAGVYNPAYTSTSSGMHLVGNPFPSPYKWDGGDANIDNIGYMWVSNGSYKGTYQPINVNDVLAIGQGFMVHTNAATTLQFLNANRQSTATASFYKNSAEKLVVDLVGNGFADKTEINFNTMATNNFDNEYDGFKIIGNYNQPTLFTVIDGSKMASVNTLPSIVQTPNVPMSLFVGTNGQYQLKVSNISSFDPTSYIFLEDTKTGSMQDMRANDSYPFSASTTDLPDRFIIHFTPPIDITTKNASCYTKGNLDVEQEGSASWNFILKDTANAIIQSGIVNRTNPLHLSLAKGEYNLVLTDANNYSVTQLISIDGASPIHVAMNTSKASVAVSEPITFTATAQNANAYDWDFGDGSSATGLQNVVHSYSSSGSYNVSLAVTNSSGCVANTSKLITVQSLTTSINNITEEQDLNIFSFGNKMAIDFSKLKNVDAKIQVYNLLGQELFNDTFQRNAIYTRAILDIEAAYLIVQVRNNNGQYIRKKIFISNSF